MRRHHLSIVLFNATEICGREMFYAFFHPIEVIRNRKSKFINVVGVLIMPRSEKIKYHDQFQ
jgi:hypothetical protein